VIRVIGLVNQKGGAGKSVARRAGHRDAASAIADVMLETDEVPLGHRTAKPQQSGGALRSLAPDGGQRQRSLDPSSRRTPAIIAAVTYTIKRL